MNVNNPFCRIFRSHFGRVALFALVVVAFRGAYIFLITPPYAGNTPGVWNPRAPITALYNIKPMDAAAQLDFFGEAKFLLEHNGDVNARNCLGETPLHLAARNDYLGIVALLVANKAKINATDDDGQTPVAEAAAMGNKSVVTYLIAHGANIDARTRAVSAGSPLGNPPLSLAVLSGNEDMVQFLLSHGAGVDIRNDDGSTPLDLAMGRADIAEVLRRQHGHA